jgi:hypothetical protein
LSSAPNLVVSTDRVSNVIILVTEPPALGPIGDGSYAHSVPSDVGKSGATILVEPLVTEEPRTVEGGPRVHSCPSQVRPRKPGIIEFRGL